MEIDWSNDESAVLARHPDAMVEFSFDARGPRYQIVARSARCGRLSVPFADAGNTSRRWVCWGR